MRLHWMLVGLGFTLLTIGHGMGLFVAPAEAMMGDVGRILYAHVPTAWVALCTFLGAFICAIGVLWTGRLKWDAAMVAAVEVGVLLNGMLLVQGSVWARPTWGVYWTWDPRLTSALVMCVSFAAVLVLRSLIHQVKRRMTFSAVATILFFVNVPVVYMSVKWWNSMHQNMSSPETVDSMMVLPLRISAFGMLFLALGLVMARARLALSQLRREDGAPDLPPAPAPLDLDTGDHDA
jgi:heme exporter protein C